MNRWEVSWKAQLAKIFPGFTAILTQPLLAEPLTQTSTMHGDPLPTERSPLRPHRRSSTLMSLFSPMQNDGEKHSAQLRKGLAGDTKIQQPTVAPPTPT